MFSTRKAESSLAGLLIRFAWATTMSLFVGMAGRDARANLIVDGGFEPPNPTTVQNLHDGGYVNFHIGDSFGGPGNNAWTVVQHGGGSAPVAVSPTTEYTFTHAGKSYYNGHSGLQWLDLTGDFDNGMQMGVQQVVATTPGLLYQLSFFVGNFNSRPTTVELDIDGISVGTFINNMTTSFPSYNSDGFAGSTWQQFSYSFSAKGTSTAIAFYNRTPSGALISGLDDVTLDVNAVPEPSTLMLLITGVGSLCIVRRRSAGAKSTGPGHPSKRAGASP